MNKEENKKELNKKFIEFFKALDKAMDTETVDYIDEVIFDLREELNHRSL